MRASSSPATRSIIRRTIGYADSFSANGLTLDAPRPFYSFAYPTTVTDADGFTSTVQYNFDFGAKTRIEGPPPQNQPNGIIQTFSYDAAARLEQVTTLNIGAYTRYAYGPNYVQSFSTVNTIADEAYSITGFDGVGRVNGAARNHPGSAGGYSAQDTIYDVMGRVKQQSNPTEINGSWVPAGDDAYNAQTGEGGWRYTQQTYDWQGRPLITTNQDGTYKEASYSGCGCAGGEVVTLTDEVGRQQKVYSDVLGRAWKTEVWTWPDPNNNNNRSVYSSSVSVFNARDQVKIANQYAGAPPSDTSSTNEAVSCPDGSCQKTTMTFDGYARLQSKHVPEQDAGTATVYAYNSDDTIQSVTDARGASATYGYNNRHLVTSINFTAPTGITPTSPVGFDYDAAGNRRWMTDGSGRVDYLYDQLSRLQSETREFDGLSGSLALSYEYNLAGQLNRITEPSGSYADYSLDATGRVTGVTGDGLGAFQYLSSAQYRAWGGLKSLAYGNSTTLAMSYNNRAQLTEYSLNGVKAHANGPIQPEGGSFQYYADSRIKFASDLRTDATMLGLHNRAYSFDHVGRLKEAYSGAEARDFLNGSGAGSAAGAFRQTYSYDSWSNLTSRTGRFWSEVDSATDSYDNQNRNPT